MKKTMKKCLILLVFIFLIVGAVNAAENADNGTVKEIQPSVKNTFEYHDDIKTIDNNISITKKNMTSDLNTKESDSTKTATTTSKTHIMNSTTFDTLVSNNMLNDNVNPGDTLDFQGVLFGERFKLSINKPVNITSTTNDAFYGNSKEIGFNIIKEGSGTNLTKIHFYNTHLCTINAHNINIDNITVEVQNALWVVDRE